MKFLSKLFIVIIIPLSLFFLIFNFEDSEKLDDFTFVNYFYRIQAFTTDGMFNNLSETLKGDLKALRNSFIYNPINDTEYEDNISGLISIYDSDPSNFKNAFDIPLVNKIIGYIRAGESYLTDLVNSSSINSSLKSTINGLADAITSFVPFTISFICVVYDYVGLGVYTLTFAFDLLFT